MGGASSAIGALGSVASAFGGGGGGGSPGTLVQTTNPGAVGAAAQIQSQAAYLAAQQAQEGINAAILNINKNYNQARYDVQPYRTAGVEALNQLNQYLGMGAYNPGRAPTTPDAPTPESMIKGSAIQQYILANTQRRHDHGMDDFNILQYSGVGAHKSKLADGTYNVNKASNTIGWNAKQKAEYNNSTGWYAPSKGIQGIYDDPEVKTAVRQYLYDENKAEYDKAYETELEAFNRNLDEYNQNKAMYEKYSAEGPLSTAQITDKITNTPGYQAELSQGLDAIQKASSAKGYLGSGRALKELSNFGQNTLSKYYNNTLDRLATIANQGQQAATNSAQLANSTGANLAGLKVQGGELQANATLSSANAQAQALIQQGQQYKIMGASSGGK